MGPKSFIEEQADRLEAWAQALEQLPPCQAAWVFTCEARALKHAAECFRAALAGRPLPEPIDDVFFDLRGEVRGRAEGALDHAVGQVVATAGFFENVSVYPPEDENPTLRAVAERLMRAAGQRS